ncbi:hypothetical protein [Streptomyces sp. NPDC051546]|uniref:hypothetical protein n=1 Tax=Streptomyces sp. NPDC051546 TaxID=3365655 RepID=UPI00379DC065
MSVSGDTETSAGTGRRRRKLGIVTRSQGDPLTDSGETAAAPDGPGPQGDGPDLQASAGEAPATVAAPEGEDPEEDLLRNFGGGLPAVVDPFAPRLLDPARLPIDPEERLRAYEAAIETSRSGLADTVMKAKFRAEVEIGLALDGIRQDELHIKKYGTIENYGVVRWGYKRSTLYELMDTAPIRIAAAAGKTVSGNPDTKGRKALAPPAQRQALESGAAGAQTEGPVPPSTPARPLRVELPKSAALALVPTWREEGEVTALAILADAVQTAEKTGKKLTAAVIRQTRLDWGVTEEPSKLTPSEEERRRAVDKTLADAAAMAERLVATLGKLGDEVPPFDREGADKHVKAIKAAGRWLNNHAKVPAGVEIVEAEIVEG